MFFCLNFDWFQLVVRTIILLNVIACKLFGFPNREEPKKWYYVWVLWEKTRILVFTTLTVSFHTLQYDLNESSNFCKPFSVFEKSTASSAYIITHILNKVSQMSMSYDKLEFPHIMRLSSKSFRYRENSNGERFSPWHTPTLHVKKSPLHVVSFSFTQDLMLLYILTHVITLYNFPFIPSLLIL